MSGSFELVYTGQMKEQKEKNNRVRLWGVSGLDCLQSYPARRKKTTYANNLHYIYRMKKNKVKLYQGGSSSIQH